MYKKEWMEILTGEYQIQKILEVNQKTERFGLILSEQDVKVLIQKRTEALKEQQRIEFGESILPKLIFTFCDSPYIYQENYVDTISRLQEIFYLYQNESMDDLSDDELLEYMKAAFDGECEGSLEYLEETVLDAFARDIRREGKHFFGKHYHNAGRGVDDEL